MAADTGTGYSSSLEDYQIKCGLEPLLKDEESQWSLAHYTKGGHDVLLETLPAEDNDRDFQVQLQKLRALNTWRHECLLTPRAIFITSEGRNVLVYEPHRLSSCSSLMMQHYQGGIEEETMLARILLDALQGLTYLHEQAVAHRNLQASDLLLSEDGRTRLTCRRNVKTLDRLARHHSYPINKNQINVFTAPEMFAHTMHHGKKNVNDLLKADIYSYGVTALQLAFGKPPAQRRVNTDILKTTMKEEDSQSPTSAQSATAFAPPSVGDYPESKFSLLLTDLVAQCVQFHAHDRPAAATLLNHDFFKQATDREVVANTLGKLIVGAWSQLRGLDGSGVVLKVRSGSGPTRDTTWTRIVDASPPLPPVKRGSREWEYRTKEFGDHAHQPEPTNNTMLPPASRPGRAPAAPQPQSRSQLPSGTATSRHIAAGSTGRFKVLTEQDSSNTQKSIDSPLSGSSVGRFRIIRDVPSPPPPDRMSPHSPTSRRLEEPSHTQKPHSPPSPAEVHKADRPPLEVRRARSLKEASHRQLNGIDNHAEPDSDQAVDAPISHVSTNGEVDAISQTSMSTCTFQESTAPNSQLGDDDYCSSNSQKTFDSSPVQRRDVVDTSHSIHSAGSTNSPAFSSPTAREDQSSHSGHTTSGAKSHTGRHHTNHGRFRVSIIHEEDKPTRATKSKTFIKKKGRFKIIDESPYNSSGSSSPPRHHAAELALRPPEIPTLPRRADTKPPRAEPPVSRHLSPAHLQSSLTKEPHVQSQLRSTNASATQPAAAAFNKQASPPIRVLQPRRQVPATAPSQPPVKPTAPDPTTQVPRPAISHVPMVQPVTASEERQRGGRQSPPRTQTVLTDSTSHSKSASPNSKGIGRTDSSSALSQTLLMGWREWTTTEVTFWLGTLGAKYKEHVGAFEEYGVDGEFLEVLTDEDLTGIGITNAVVRKKIILKVQKLKKLSAKPPQAPE